MELENKIRAFEHQFNPAHFYCRLRELGIDKSECALLSIRYEQLIYKEYLQKKTGIANY